MHDLSTTTVRYGTVVLRGAWWVAVVGAATALGAFLGWRSHGLSGAIALGLVGFGGGCALAAYPGTCLDLITGLFEALT